MAVSASGARSQGVHDVLRFRSRDVAASAKRPFPLAILFAEDVTSTRAPFGGLAAGSHLEALLDSFVRLLLWHSSTILLLEVSVHFCPGEGDGGVSRASPEAVISADSRPSGRESGGSIDSFSTRIPATFSNASDLMPEVCAGSERSGRLRKGAKPQRVPQNSAIQPKSASAERPSFLCGPLQRRAFASRLVQILIDSLPQASKDRGAPLPFLPLETRLVVHIVFRRTFFWSGLCLEIVMMVH